MILPSTSVLFPPPTVRHISVHPFPARIGPQSGSSVLPIHTLVWARTRLCASRLNPRDVSGDSGIGNTVGKLNLELVEHARKMFDGLPQPVKNFPWVRLVSIFQTILLQLATECAKYLCVPLLAITSLSEMSYCAHEKIMWVIPVPFFAGLAAASVLRSSIAEHLENSKEGKNEYPWPLILAALFFLLLKLLGPYYPYWGRLVIPHFANGALWRTSWMAFQWLRSDSKRSSSFV